MSIPYFIRTSIPPLTQVAQIVMKTRGSIRVFGIMNPKRRRLQRTVRRVADYLQGYKVVFKPV